MRERFSLVEVELESGQRALALRDSEKPKQKPIVVDFESPQLTFRLKNGADSELLVKSMGVKASEREGKLVVDATAGLGTDAFVLASAGFHVVAYERNEWIYRLLVDGKRRLDEARKKSGESTLNLEFRLGDGMRALSQWPGGKPFAIYLDPMFESKSTKGKSLPRKEMAILRDFLTVEEGDWSDEICSFATGRVVVKRPPGAPALFMTPQRRVESKSAAYDIYPCR